MNPSDKVSYFKASLVDMGGVINNEVRDILNQPINQNKQNLKSRTS